MVERVHVPVLPDGSADIANARGSRIRNCADLRAEWDVLMGSLTVRQPRQWSIARNGKAALVRTIGWAHKLSSTAAR